MQKCGVLLPRFDHEFTPNGEMLPCLLEHSHEGDHITKLKDGSFLKWDFDPCGECGEDCECFTSARIESINHKN